MSKLCTNCHKNLPLHNYYKRNISPDGLAYVCKECSRIKHQEWLTVAKSNMSYRKRQHEASRIWRKKNKIKVRAHALAQNYKSLIKKDRCGDCGIMSNLHMHHSDYSRPLEIVTLCKDCHENMHHSRRILA